MYLGFEKIVFLKFSINHFVYEYKDSSNKVSVHFGEQLYTFTIAVNGIKYINILVVCTCMCVSMGRVKTEVHASTFSKSMCLSSQQIFLRPQATIVKYKFMFYKQLHAQRRQHCKVDLYRASNFCKWITDYENQQNVDTFRNLLLEENTAREKKSTQQSNIDCIQMMNYTKRSKCRQRIGPRNYAPRVPLFITSSAAERQVGRGGGGPSLTTAEWSFWY